MMTRRQFLARSALLGSAAWLAAAAPGRLLAASAGKPLGIQLYMVLKAYQDDPLGTLKTLKAIGYTEIEAIVTSTAKTLRDQLNEAGLACPSMHFDSLGVDPGIEAAHTLGAPYFVSSMLPAYMAKIKGDKAEPTYTRDDAKRTAAFSEVAKFLQSQGYTPEEMNGLTDHRAVMVAMKAAKYDALQAAKAKQAKPEPPKPVRPGAASQGAPNSAKQRAQERLKRDPNDLSALADLAFGQTS